MNIIKSIRIEMLLWELKMSPLVRKINKNSLKKSYKSWSNNTFIIIRTFRFSIYTILVFTIMFYYFSSSELYFIFIY